MNFYTKYFKYLLVLCFLQVSLFSISTCRGQNSKKIENKLGLQKNEYSYSKQKLQSFRISLSDSWFGKDKADHFLVSAFLMAGSYYFFKEEQNISNNKSICYSISFAFSLGIAKEIKDGLSLGNSASVKDVVVDVLGIALGTFLFNME